VIELTGATECACTLDDLWLAEEVFLSSTIREVQPVVAIDDHEYSDEVGPVTRRTAEQLRAHIESELAA
jgi:branched-chain amino acid aminotransferase